MANTRVLNAAVVAALFAACTDVPCETKGAVRDHRDVCGCPDATREVKRVVNDDSKSECVSGDAGGVAIDNASEADASRVRPVAADGGREMESSLLVDAAKEAGKETEASVLTVADAGDVLIVADDAGDVLTLADAGIPKMPVVPACIPAAEDCDGKDDDCDGLIDEEVSEAPLGATCGNNGQGVCAMMGKQVCVNGAVICNAPPPNPQPELCDGIDNDCKNGVDDTFANKGKACTAGKGDCLGTGVLECDPADPAKLRCTAVEKPKNACGVTCGPVPDEDCDTTGDDNCNGQQNEGCPPPVVTPPAAVCGDGARNGREECDPTSPGSSAFTCSTQCLATTNYTACELPNSALSCVGDTFCTSLATCGSRCSESSACPGIPGWPATAFTCATQESRCVAQCTPAPVGDGRCPPGTTCHPTAHLCIGPAFGL